MTQDFYSFIGFISNPFENNTAEREPEIEHYAVRPPYLDRVQKASTSKGIFILFGKRGSGKSATRITVSKKLWSGSGGGMPIVIPIMNFNVFKQYPKDSIPLDLYANQICFLVIEHVLGWLSTFDSADSEELLANIKPAQRNLIDKLVVNFYLNRTETARNVSGQECFETLDLSLQRKGKIWLDKRWNEVAAVVATLAAKFGKKYADFDVGDPKYFAAMLQRQHQEGFGDPQYLFAKTVEFARAFGFSGIILHVDKVDETDWTGNDVSAAASLIYPLLSNIQLHEIDGLTWTFFLWDKVREYLTPANNHPVRWDKIPNGEISWTDEYLSQLIDRRVQYFSKRKLSGVMDICEKNIDVKTVILELIQLSESSPRKLVTLMDSVMSEHIQFQQGNHTKLNMNSFSLGMDTYSTSSLNGEGLGKTAGLIAKLQMESFVTKDVSVRSRLSPQAARGKIDEWIKSGLVEYQDSQVGASGGRPVDRFIVSDPRLKRIIDRDLQI